MKLSSEEKSQRSLTIYFGLSTELVSILFLSRMIADTSVRMFTPFIPDFSAGLGLTITSFSWILTVRSLMGLISPFIGVLADRYGRRLVLVSALLLRSVGLLWLANSSGWGSLMPMMILSLSTSGYYPVLRAYVSDLALPARRARALAVVDASFPTAGILGLPLVGWLIEGWGWGFPIWILAGLCLVSALVMAISLPTIERTMETSGMLDAMVTLVKKPKVMAALVVSTLVLMIFTLFFLFWALLLKEEFQFSPLQIGLTGTLVGIAELFGLIVAGLIVDQLGKRRGTLIGLSACVLILPAFLFAGGNLNLIRLLLVLFMVMFEFGITASIPLIAEQTNENRATLFCMVSLGNTFGAGISPPLVAYLWSWGGSLAVVVTGSLLTLVAVILVSSYLFDEKPV